MTDPERNAEQLQDRDHFMNVSDGEEAHVEGVDQVRDSDKSSEQTESVL